MFLGYTQLCLGLYLALRDHQSGGVGVVLGTIWDVGGQTQVDCMQSKCLAHCTLSLVPELVFVLVWLQKDLAGGWQ